MATIKQRLRRRLENGTYDTIHMETSSDLVLRPGTSETVEAALNNKLDKVVAFAVTLAANGWSSNVQTISDSRFVVDGHCYVPRPNSASMSAYDNAGVKADDVTVAGKMTFRCTTTPTAALTVNIMKVASKGE